MRQSSCPQPDPIEREIEFALRPRTFIRDGECFSFVSGLEAVASRIDRLIESDSKRACALYETLLAGCTAKANELDDSSGNFGQFAGNVICGWIKARCTGDLDRDETVGMLLGWMDDDPFAFFHDLGNSVVEAFDRTGLPCSNEGPARASRPYSRYSRARSAPGRPPPLLAATLGRHAAHHIPQAERP